MGIFIIKIIILVSLLFAFLTNGPQGFASNKEALSNTDTSLVGRSQKDFAFTAFCSYKDWHPQQYLVDNNWDILCAFREPATVDKLNELEIPYTKSQLRLLEIGGLLRSSSNDQQTIYTTSMPIFDKKQTEAIRTESKQFADSLFMAERPLIKQLTRVIAQNGWEENAYSLMFSYLLDGIIWNEGKLPVSESLGDYPTWSGCFWAMYDKRSNPTTGTNGYGNVKMTWTYEQGFWPGTKMMLKYANQIDDRNINATGDDMIDWLASWGITDTEGNPTVPVIHEEEDNPFNQLCDEISSGISNAVLSHSNSLIGRYNLPDRKNAATIFYHEVMWDLLSLLEQEGLVVKPQILKGAGEKKDLGRIVYIVLNNQ